jgi:ElaB/YqjD/DUF883 family membrane-anchored ribosome-binding protein
LKRFYILICVFSILLISFPSNIFAYSNTNLGYDYTENYAYIDVQDLQAKEHTTSQEITELSDINLVEKYTKDVSTEKELSLVISYQAGILDTDFNSSIYQRFITNYQEVVSTTLNILQNSLTGILSEFSWLCPEDPEEIRELARKLLELRRQLITLENGGIGGNIVASVIKAKIIHLTAKISDLQVEIANLQSEIDNLIAQNDPNSQEQIDELNIQVATLIAEMLAAIAEKSTLQMALNESQRRRMIESIEAIIRFLSDCLQPKKKINKQEKPLM